MDSLKSRILLVLALLLLCAALATTACGGDEPDEDEPSTESGATPDAEETSNTNAATSAVASFARSNPDNPDATILDMVCVNRTLRSCGLLESFFIPEIEKETKELSIGLVSYADLDLAGTDSLSALANGEIDVAEIYHAYVQEEIPALGVANLVGLSKSESAHLALIEQVREESIGLIRKSTGGGQVIARLFYPSQYIYSIQELPNLRAYQGKKIYYNSEILKDLLDGLGANVELEIPFVEVYSAMERRSLDGAIGSGTAGYGQRWYEPANFMYGPIPGSIEVTYLTMSASKWQSLPRDLQELLLRTGSAFEEENLRLLQDKWTPDGVKLSTDQGLEYSDFPEDVKQEIRQVALEYIIPNWSSRAGGPNSEGVKIFNTRAGPLLGLSVNVQGDVGSSAPVAKTKQCSSPDRKIGNLCIRSKITETEEVEAFAATPCDGESEAAVSTIHGGGSPSGSSCGLVRGVNFNLTPLVTEGENYEIHIACINPTLVDCLLLKGEYLETEDIGFAERVKRRTNGQVSIIVDSLGEHHIEGADVLAKVGDGTLDAAQVYPGYISQEYPIFDITSLWGSYFTESEQLTVIDVIQPYTSDFTDEQGGIQIAYMFTESNYIFSNTRITNDLSSLDGVRVRSHSTVLSNLLAGLGMIPEFIPFSEVGQALEDKTIDAAVTCLPCGYAMGWHEQSVALMGPIVSIGHSWISVHKPKWDTLPVDLQNIILEEGARSSYINRELLLEHFIPKTINKITQNSEVEFISMTDELKVNQKQTSLDSVIPSWVETVGGPESDAVSLFNSEIAHLVGVQINGDGSASYR